MQIFIDESGSFVNAPAGGSFNCIAGYMSPESDRRRVQKHLDLLKRAVRAGDRMEVKLKDVEEPIYFGFLAGLSRFAGVLYTVATDAGLNQPEDIDEHQRQQAAKIVAYKDKLHYQSARDGLQALADRIESLAPQLYVQLHCQINLIEAIVRHGVLYFVQRYPRHLGQFRWQIDQKNSRKTEYEAAFFDVAPAFLQGISLRAPMPKLEGADYSVFSRFDVPAEDKPTYLKDQYGIEIGDDAATNIGMLIRENMQFVDSKSSWGVQVADLLASGVRRCLRQQFSDNRMAAHLLGQLMVQSYKGDPPIQLLGFSRDNLPVSGNVAELVNIMNGSCRGMIVR